MHEGLGFLEEAFLDRDQAFTPGFWRPGTDMQKRRSRLVTMPRTFLPWRKPEVLLFAGDDVADEHVGAEW